MTRDLGPPGGGGRSTQTPAHRTDTGHSSGNRGRRCAAKKRMPPIGTCGCIRDSLFDRHRCDGQVSDVQAQAAADAVAYLDSLGTPGLLDQRTCRAMWRVGHRQLAVKVHARTTGESQ
jgi:hypothetical protein